jgi:hypothetical protein
MFLTPRLQVPGTTGRREKSDHQTLEEAQLAFAAHPNRREFEALIYVEGVPAWLGTTDRSGRVVWSSWSI